MQTRIAYNVFMFQVNDMYFNNLNRKGTLYNELNRFFFKLYILTVCILCVNDGGL